MAVTLEGDLRKVEGDETRATVRGSLFSLALDEIAGRRFHHNTERTPFEWAYKAFDGFGSPVAADCFAPRRILTGLEYIEREATRSAKGYPAEWRWWLHIEGQQRSSLNNLTAFYKGRRCLFFSDDKGFWARELEPGKLEGAHHDLSLESSVLIQLEPDGPSMELRIERHPFFVGFADTIARFKRICHIAREGNHLILVWHG
jgi:hypothetical protein